MQLRRIEIKGGKPADHGALGLWAGEDDADPVVVEGADRH